MNKDKQEINKLLDSLRDPRTIRKQAQRILALAKQDKLAHFVLNPEKNPINSCLYHRCHQYTLP